MKKLKCNNAPSGARFFKLWGIITSFFVILASIISVASDTASLSEIVSPIFLSETTIKGELYPSGTVKVGTELTFKYSVPSNGYYSIWNQNNEGKLIKIWPVNSDLKSIDSNGHEKLQAYPFPLLAATPHSQENILILWSKKPNHPSMKIYNTWEEFNEFIDTHSYDWKIKTFPIQVL